MDPLNPIVLQRLQHMAREGLTVSQMLRYILETVIPERPHKVTLIRYMREAFGLSLQQASPIAGWAPPGAGELQDAQLDELLMPAIWAQRAVWDVQPPSVATVR